MIVMADLFASTSGPQGAECFRIPAQWYIPGYVWKPGVGVIVAWTDKLYPASYVILHCNCKKHLPGRIVPLRVPFHGYACPNVHVRNAKREAGYKHLGAYIAISKNVILCSPTEYSLKNASFRLHPVWGTHPADPAVTIAGVLSICPSRINGNVGHKHKSQATQLGQNLSHIDAYNGEKGKCRRITHMRGMKPGK